MTEKRKPGRPPKLDAKAAVTLRVDPVLLAQWKASGGDWRTRMAAQIRAPGNPEEVCKAQRPKPAAKSAPAIQPDQKASGAPVRVSIPFAGTIERKPMQKSGKR